ncbi:MAG: hypothetical protein L0216_15395 [Planctomycetales bacterium]|nr:hypothetical protein [Planctomycetales bacterium]
MSSSLPNGPDGPGPLPPSLVPERPTRRLEIGRSRHVVSAACLLTLLSVGVALAHFLVPTPLLFALLMSVGNGAYALALVLYVAVVLTDLRRRRVL